MTSKQNRYFEDVADGEKLPLLTKGPLTTAHLMRWSAASENWHKIHYDRTFTREHDKLPDLLINGSLKQQFIFEALQAWAKGGWVWKVKFQFRAMNLVGERLSVWARVVSKCAQPEYGLVSIEFGIVNDLNLESTPGKATVVLPYRDGSPVPYPFSPTAADLASLANNNT